MKIANFSDSYLPEMNGVSFSIQSFTKELLKKGHTISIYAPSYGEKGEKETLPGDKLHEERFYSIPFPRYNEAQITFPNFYKIYRSLRRMKPDIIHVHTPGPVGLSGILYGKLLHIPVVGTYHSLFAEMLDIVNPSIKHVTGDEKETVSQKITWQLINLIFSQTQVTITPTDTIKHELSRRKVKNKIITLSNGIDLSLFPNGKNMIQGKRLLYVGRLSREKNIDVLIHAFQLLQQKLPEAELTIAGMGPQEESLKELVISLGLSDKIHFIGSVKRESLSIIYNSHDLFVTASTMETQSLVILEALASGLPIVGVKKYGLIDMVYDDYNGYLATPFDTEEIAECIYKILTSSSLHKKFSQNSRVKAEENDLNISVVQLEKLYENAIAKYKSKNIISDHKKELQFIIKHVKQLTRTAKKAAAKLSQE